MVDFEALCKHIIDTNGHPRKEDILSFGYSNENAKTLTQPNVRHGKMVKNAREALLARDIHYKEAN